MNHTPETPDFQRTRPSTAPATLGQPPAFPGFRSLKANFTSVPNQYFDRVVGHYHPCVERVIAILIRATLGWEDPDTGERRLEAELPLSAFIRPELSESSARKGIAGAIEAGFVVQTLPATNKAPARYALRWEDQEAQKHAIAKQRRAHKTTRRRGVAVMDSKWKRQARGVTVTPLATSTTSRGVTVTPVTVTPVTVTPPINKGVLNKSSSEKKKEEKAEGCPVTPPTPSLGALPIPGAASGKKESFSFSSGEDQADKPNPNALPKTDPPKPPAWAMRQARIEMTRQALRGGPKSAEPDWEARAWELVASGSPPASP